jgi:hypothetical protein
MMKFFSSAFAFLSLAVVLRAEMPEPKFRAVTLDDKIQIGYGIAVSDVDGDRAADVLLADKKQFAWYRNPGPARASEPLAWTKHLLAENLTEKDNVCLAAEDLDGDGKCEIAVGAEWNPADTEKSGAVFYLIAPEDRTQRWEAVRFPNVEPTTHRMKWVRCDSRDSRRWGLVVLPLHGRGNKNGEGEPVKMLCYEKPSDPRGEWKGELVDESLHMTHSFDLGHTESTARDGGLGKMVIAGKEGFRITTRNDGAGAEKGPKWTSTAAEFGGSSDFSGAGEVRARIDSNGRFFAAAIEPMHGHQLVIYRSRRAGEKTSVPRRVLTDQLTDGHALALGDLLGVGSDQIVAGWRGNPNKPRPVGIKLFTASDEVGERWREDLIDDDMACEDLVLADLNSDGKLDIVASGRSTRNVKLYFNQR